MDSGPSTPLPDKKLLVFILDRLQKCVFLALLSVFLTLCGVPFYLIFNFLGAFNFRKDVYGVFSEPVDPNEVGFGSDDTISFWVS